MLLALVLLPLSSVLICMVSLSFGQILQILSDSQIQWAFLITVLVSLAAAAISTLFGLILAWVLSRYEFPGRKLMDALIELPLALPTAVAGITLAKLYSDTGIMGKLGFTFSYTHAGMIIALMFVDLPFTVRSVQPVITGLPASIEEAASMLGADAKTAFRKVVLPQLWTPLISGFALSFARGVGEYGSLIYISGNSRKEHTQPLSSLIMQKLNYMDYASASVLSFLMLLLSFLILILIHTISYAGSRKYASMQTDSLVPVSPKKPGSWQDFGLILIAAVYLLTMLGLPVLTIVTQAFSKGLGFYLNALRTQTAVSSYGVSLLAAGISVPLVTFFGIAAAMLLGRFEFRGKRVISALIDIPFSVSPVIAGLSFIMMFGRLGWAYPLIDRLGIQIVFALPGVVLATTFIIFPYVSRELVPVLSQTGKTEEEAAAIMGAGGFTILRRISLPKMKWALIYGVMLAAARAFGEFGAVAALSKTRGSTFTLPLEIDALYYAGSADSLVEAFALSSLMLMLAGIFLILKSVVGKARKGA